MGSSSEAEPSRIGDWVRISVLGSGGFGTVSLWRSNLTTESIAVKKCKLHCPTSLTPKHKERWCKEVQKMKELNHPNIVKYKSLPPLLEKELNKMNPSKLPLLSMEYCQKGNLRHVLTQPLNMCGLEENTITYVLLDISSALNYLHSNKITHRDIKPENIVLQNCPDRSNQVIYKLIDLGYAKELNDVTVSFVGTLFYLAPEIYANRNYDCSVDYWSLGVLAFETICGVLPFLSRIPATERYRLIKEKEPEDICMFINHMGNIQYSSKVFQENRINSCLKGHMEVWLQKALQFDPKERREPFPNSRNIFEQLHYILKKKFLKIFVVYKYQFYTYEFDECTKVSTVRQWISRDTDIAEREQLLLGRFQFGGCDDDTLISNCFIDENFELFLFKRNELFNIERHYYPRLVKMMFEKATVAFSWHELKAIYSHSINYIQRDIELASAFSRAMDLYLKQFTMMMNMTAKKWKLCRENVMGLVKKVEDFNIKARSRKFSCIDMDLASKFSRLLSSVEKCSCDEYKLAVNIEKFLIKVRGMKTINLKDDIIKFSELEKFLEEAVVCLQKAASILERSKSKISCGNMLKIVSEVIRYKDSILIDQNLRDYARYLGNAVSHIQFFSTWMESFDAHVHALHKICDSVVAEAGTRIKNSGLGICSDVAEPTRTSGISNNSPTRSVMEDAEILSSRFAELVDESVNSYKNYRDEVEFCIQDIFSTL